jgi:hypothetical protein
MDKLTPITITNLYRSILGRVGDVRANRVISVQGTVVGYPKAPLNELGLRNLLAKSIDVADDGKAAIRVYVSSGNVRNAYFPREAHLNLHRYLNSTFVDVRQADGKVVTAVNIVLVGGELPVELECPDFDGWDAMSLTFDSDTPQDVVIPATYNGADIESITDDKDYELTEDVHYEVGEESLTIKTDYLLYAFDEPEGEEPDCRTLTVVFDNDCPDVTFTICNVAEVTDIDVDADADIDEDVDADGAFDVTYDGDDVDYDGSDVDYTPE